MPHQQAKSQLAAGERRYPLRGQREADKALSIFASKNPNRKTNYVKVAPSDFAALLKEQWRLKPDALSAEQAAQLLGYTTTTVAKWIKAGKLKAIPYQRGYMIPKEWLVRYLADTVNDSRATKSEKHMRLIRKCQKE